MKTKILVIGALPPPTGGMETVTEQMSKMKLKDYHIKIFNVAKNKIIKSNMIFNILNFVYRCFKLIMTILLENPKIIHIHITVNRDFLQKAIYIKIAKMLNKKIIVHIHGGAFKEFYDKSSKNKKQKITRVLNSVDSLIVLSRSWYEFFKGLCPKQKIYVLSNSVDIEIIEEYRKKHNNKNAFRILYVGRIEKQKGINELITAFSKIRNENLFLDIMGVFMNNEKEIRKLTENLNFFEIPKSLFCDN